jgi:hypothetical protein
MGIYLVHSASYRDDSAIYNEGCGRNVEVEVFAMKLQAFVALVLHVYLTCAASSSTQVTLDKGTFVGTTDGSVNKYLGIPYAQPP